MFISYIFIQIIQKWGRRLYMNLEKNFVDTINKINLNKMAVIFVLFLFIIVGFIMTLNEGVKL